MVPKTKYTSNPCSSIDMNNGLGSRGGRPRWSSPTLPWRARAADRACMLVSGSYSPLLLAGQPRPDKTLMSPSPLVPGSVAGPEGG